MTVTRKEMYEYWDQAASVDTDEQGLRPTARDPYLQKLIENVICNYIENNDRILDIGCGDGISTLKFAELTKNEVLGTDFIEKYVQKSEENRIQSNLKNVSFSIANVLDLSGLKNKYNLFDKVITIRCLINLTTWQEQKRAIKEIASLVEPGGYFITSEGWKENFDHLNERRKKFGLEEMVIAKYNTMISRSLFEDAIQKYFTIEKYHGFGQYIFLSRVLHPAIVHPKLPKHNSKINEIAAHAQMVSPDESCYSDCDYPGIYVLKRK